MIAVSEALERLFALVAPLDVETVALRKAAGRILAEPAVARRDQPPFAASAMDGYAVAGSAVLAGAAFTVIGEAAAGRRFEGAVGAGEAVRIFTGAPLPQGTDRVVIQEDVTRAGDRIVIAEGHDTATHVRPLGADFAAGFTLSAPRRLTAPDLALLAAMNVPQVQVYRQPVVALIPTGDELVQPGEEPGPDQIIASNTYGLAAMLEAAGAKVRLLPIARDNEPALRQAFGLAKGADLVVTIGGASVGDHDLVGRVAGDLGMERSFYKIAMRPGKPLMAGRINGAAMIGLPGNPVSAMVCGAIFLLPVVARMQGLPAAPAPRQRARLATPVTANGPREHYMRAHLDRGDVTVFAAQDSALLSVLSQANVLLVRPPDDPAQPAGAEVEVVAL